MASPNLSEIVTTTLRNRSGELADNVSANNALLARLTRRGNMKLVDGGRSLVRELEYAENSTFQRYSGYETLDVSPSDVFTAAEYDWKQYAVTVSMSGLEEIQNSGAERIIDLLESRIQNAYRTMRNNVSADIYSDGTASGGKQIGGLQLLVADDPTSGVVGGINRGTWTFWRNQRWRSSSDGGVTSINESNIQRLMNDLYIRCSRGNDKPDLIVADNAMYSYYLNSLQAIQRITSPDSANLGFNSLKFLGADVVLDGGYGGDAPTEHMYFLNTNYIKFETHRSRNFVPLERRLSVNQDAMAQPIVWAGNLTLSNAFLQGVLYED